MELTEDQLRTIISKNLKTLREEREKMSINLFSEKLMIERRKYTSIENGNSDLSAMDMYRLEKRCNITFKELSTDDGLDSFDRKYRSELDLALEYLTEADVEVYEEPEREGYSISGVYFPERRVIEYVNDLKDAVNKELDHSPLVKKAVTAKMADDLARTLKYR
jgi:transcriptional regulator with XRE-family HTH domain